MMCPNFLIVGAAKCGTTTLYTWLKRHPDVFMPWNKEPTCFVRSIPSKMTFTEYTSLFKPGYAKIGEASVAYLYDYHSPKLIKKYLGGDIKIIVCVRHPAEMVYSLWKHNIRDEAEDLSFKDALNQENNRLTSNTFKHSHPNNHINFYYTDRARFGEQILRYYHEFSKRNVLIVPLEDIREEPKETYKGILSFLGLKFVETQFTKENVAGGLHSVVLNRMLMDSSSIIRKPFKLLPTKIKKRLWHFLYYSNRKTSGGNFSPMSQEIRCEIMYKLTDDLTLLRRLTGISYRDEHV